MQRRMLVATLASCFLISIGPHVMPPAQVPATGDVIEITGTDLFATDHWLSTQVSAKGLMLGMSRRWAVEVLAPQHLNLDDDSGQGCGSNSSVCYVLRSGIYTGMTVAFGDKDTIEKIAIDAYNRAASKDERSACISRDFLGKTRELVEDYSDNSRLRILGNAEEYAVKLPRFPRTRLLHSPRNDRLITHYQYLYIRRGLILHTYLSGWDGFGGRGPLDKLVLELVPPPRQ